MFHKNFYLNPLCAVTFLAIVSSPVFASVNFPSFTLFSPSHMTLTTACSNGQKFGCRKKIIFPRRHLTLVVKSRRYKKRARKVEASSSVAIKQYWHLIKITRRRKDSFDVNFSEWGASRKAVGEQKFVLFCFRCGLFFYDIFTATSEEALFEGKFNYSFRNSA